MYTLVVVDMQPLFLERFYDYDHEETKQHVVKQVQRAVVQAIADGAEIIDVNYDSHRWNCGTTIPEIADLWKDYKGFFPNRVKYVKKHCDSGSDQIMKAGVAEPQIRVCGINAGACVLETVRDLACDWEQDVSVIGDAVANSWSTDAYDDLDEMEQWAMVE